MARAFPGIAAILFLILSVSLALPVAAQETTGNLVGRVLDGTGTPIGRANVSISGPNLIGTRGAATDENGFFTLLALPSGVYTARISHVSYQTLAVANIRVPLGATATLPDVRLDPQILEAGEVVVSAKRSALDLTSTAFGANLTPPQFEDLPLPRNYQAITTLVPQANESIYGDGIGIAGATGLETKYFIAGVDVTNPVTSGSSTTLPYNFVREIQVRTGAYDAEYRGSLGGLVDVETLSGGNELSGQFYGFFTNSDLTGKARQGTEPLPEESRQYDVGGRLGGPIIKDKLWFMGAYNPLTSRESVPLAGFGDFEDSRTVHAFASKISWRTDDKNTVHLSVFGDPTTGRLVESIGGAAASFEMTNPDMVLFTVEKGTINVAATGTHVLNERVALESHAAWMRLQDRQEPENPPSEDQVRFEDYVTRTVSGGPWGGFENTTNEISAGLKSTFTFTDHTLKAGVDFTTLDQSLDYRFHLLSRPSDSLYVEQVQFRDGELGQTIWGTFLQDSWRVSPGWRLNAGLRWDPQLLRASDGRTAQKFLDQLAPRLGVVYLPGGSGASKITASAGRYYQMLSMYVQQFYELSATEFVVTQYDHDPRLDRTGGEVVARIVPKIQPDVPGMEGQHYDELTLGYERQIEPDLKVGARGIYRTLREGIEDGLDPATFDGFFGNPGEAPLEAFPEAERDYAALELSAERAGALSVRGSYVLSRTRGNYPGLFDYRFRDDRANSTAQFDLPEFLVNATGLLPNDRTHVFKLFGAYRSTAGLTFGASFLWESGIPLSEYGGSSLGYPLNFISQRGTNGRTPALWDLSLRSVYEFDQLRDAALRPRLILDVFHIGSPREAVDYDQVHYFSIGEDGNQTNPNPQYLAPIQFQPPMSVRLGMEVDF